MANTTTEPGPQALLHLLHLGSPALPVGAFAYSQGLEYAIDAGWLNDARAIQDWIGAVISQGLCQLDLPLLLRMHSALEARDLDQAERWNRQLLASRESHELRLEDSQIGSALRRLLGSLSVPVPGVWQQAEVSQAAMLALACQHWQLPAEQVATSLVWSFVENQLAVAAKVLPMGQTQGQQALLALMPTMTAAVARAMQLDTEDIGATLPGQVWASCRHETQYSRLFRS